jgi:hypothetical protein
LPEERNRAKTIATCLTVLLVGVVVVFGVRIHDKFNLKKILKVTRFQHMEDIRRGVVLFEEKTGRSPSNLAEIVSAECLPPEAIFYWCPLRHDKIPQERISHERCEYEILFDSRCTSIVIPREFISDQYAALLGADVDGYRVLRHEFGSMHTE